MAVGKDHKLLGDRIVPGKVGHDRIQQATGTQSIGEAIRYWYGIRGGADFERIDVEAEIHAKGKSHPHEHFIVTPIAVKMRASHRAKPLERIHSPLSFHQDYQSKLWREQIDQRRAASKGDVTWAAAQLSRVVAEHRDGNSQNILESDLLRAAGALSHLGLELSPYLGKGYDCISSRFQFLDLPMYPCPVELKKESTGFKYQIVRYLQLPRAVVLCMNHGYVNPPTHIDFIALSTLADYLNR